MKAALVGCPNAGKSTLLSEFSRRGYPVVPEMATKVIEEDGILPGLDKTTFRYAVVRAQRRAEQQQDTLPRSNWRIHDRGEYDGEPYCLIEGTPVPDFLSQARPNLYDIAFVLEPVRQPESNAVRALFPGEDEAYCRQLNDIFVRVYENKGVPVVRVPFASVEERMNTMLAVMSTLSYRNGLHIPDSYCGEAMLTTM